MAKQVELTEDQWALVRKLLPKSKARDDGKGRPRRDDRDILSGVLWILKTGARWQDLPERYPPYQTCHRRFQEWVKQGTLEKILKALAEDLLRRGKLDLEEAYIDGTFSSAKKGVLWLVQRSGEKGARSWQSRTAGVFLSPPGLRALRRMKLHSSSGLLRSVLHEQNPRFLLETKPMTRTRSMSD